jgi:YVTN family beta-propeller protein
MSYSLGVDLGTTFVAAAIAHASRVEMFTLGDRAVVAPAVVYVREDGTVMTGDAAGRRSVSSPDRVGREFKRRLGDPTPVMLGGAPHAVTALLGALLADVVNRVMETEGTAPERVVLTHPANWGPFRRALFDEVPQLAGVPTPQMVTEPEAAAAHYAASRHLDDGDTVAVYDLGGGTFDATVLCKRGEGIEILGTPEGIERLGGVDFDEAILSYVNYSSGQALSELNMSDPQTAIALARLRQDAILAKEALSIDTETTIPVLLPHRHFDVRVTRADFENLIRAQIESTIGALTRTLRSANVTPEELSAVLLVGGSSRIPLVGRMISEALGRPTVVDTHPKYAVALGAATLAGQSAGLFTRGGDGATALAAPPVIAAPREPARSAAPRGTLPQGAPAAPTAAAGATARVDPPTDPSGPSGGGPVPPPPPPLTPSGGGSQRTVALAAGAALVLLIGALGWFFLGGTGGDAPTPPQPTPILLPSPERRSPDKAELEIDPSVPIPAVTSTVDIGRTPGFVTVRPDGAFAYVAGRAAGVVTVVETNSNKVVATIPIPDGPPQYLAFDPDGKRLYVSVFNDPDRSINEVAILDTTTNTVKAKIKVGTRPYALAVTPDGRQLYVPNHGDGTVSVIDTATEQLVTTITVKPNPHWVEFSEDGTRAYTANHESNLITVLDTASHTVVAEIPVQKSPHSVAVHPTRPLVASADYDSDSVSVIDTNNEKIIATVPVGKHPQDLTWSADGRHAYVTNVDGDDMTVIDADTWTVTATLPTGDAPTSIAVTPDGRQAYVSNLNSGTLTVLKVGTVR